MQIEDEKPVVKLTARLSNCPLKISSLNPNSTCDLYGYSGLFCCYISGENGLIYRNDTALFYDTSIESWYSYLPKKIWSKYLNNRVKNYFNCKEGVLIQFFFILKISCQVFPKFNQTVSILSFNYTSFFISNNFEINTLTAYKLAKLKPKLEMVNFDFDNNTNNISIRCRLPCSETTDCSVFKGFGAFNVTFNSGSIHNYSRKFISNRDSINLYLPLKPNLLIDVYFVIIYYLNRSISLIRPWCKIDQVFYQNLATSKGSL